MEGKIKLNKPITSKKFGVVFPNNVILKSFMDNEKRIYVEHPVHKNVSTLVKSTNISDVVWNDMDIKPKFFQAILVELNEQKLNNELRGCSLEERLPNNGRCPECTANQWWLLPKASIAIKQGGKSYIECLICGYQTHL